MPIVGTETTNDSYFHASTHVLLVHALRICVGTGTNDFFLLHGLNCAFSLQVIFDAVPFLPKTKMDASNVLKIALVAVEWIQICQDIALETQCWRKQLQRIRCNGEHEIIDPESVFLIAIILNWMEELIQFLRNKNTLVPRNEHACKCAVMCRISICRSIHQRQFASKKAD